jgi:pimeloyl-ACP methyl ester carboxylesterase
MIRRGYADSRDGQIHYRSTGGPDAPVVCLFHQTASSGVMFEKVMTRLADRYRLYAFDSPGFGQSFQPEAIPSVGYLSDRLIEAIADLGITRFHAVGHHTGGCVAIEMPVRYPQRVATLTIIGPVLVNEQEKNEYQKTFVRPFAIEPSGAYLTTAWDYLRMIGAGTDVELHNREMADHLIAHRSMPMAFSAVWQQDFQYYYRAVRCPLHIMCSKNDVLWPLFERAGQVRPDATQSIVTGGDFQPDNDPDGVATALAPFLARHP